MNPVFAAAVAIHTFCEQRCWRFCFIGGVAVHRWGEPRATDDVDLTLLTGFGGEEAFIEELLRHFSAREANAREFALQRRVLFLTAANETNADIALGAIPFEERTIARSSIWMVEQQHPLRICSAEDLVVHKCFAARDQDWTDVDGILARQRGKLNFDLIRAELKPLLELKGEPEIAQRLEKLIARHAQPFRHIKPVPPES